MEGSISNILGSSQKTSTEYVYNFEEGKTTMRRCAAETAPIHQPLTRWNCTTHLTEDVQRCLLVDISASGWLDPSASSYSGSHPHPRTHLYTVHYIDHPEDALSLM